MNKLGTWLEIMLRRTAQVSVPLALLVMVMPWLLIIGFMMLIVPGVILAVMPTLALWSLTALGLAWLLRARFERPVAALLCVPATLLLMAAIPFAANSLAWPGYRAATKDGDVLPAGKIGLAGAVRIYGPQPFGPNQPENGDYDAFYRTRPFACNALCMAVLGTPGVREVTVDDAADRSDFTALSPHARTFRLLPRAQCPLVTAKPVDPGQLEITRTRPAHANMIAAAYSVNAEWDLRLSTDECLVELPASHTADQVMVLTERRLREPKPGQSDRNEGFAPKPIQQSRVMLLDGQGKVLLRRTVTQTRFIAYPLTVEPYEHGTYNFAWRIGQHWISNAPAWPGLQPHQVLADKTNLYTGADAAALRPMIRARVAHLAEASSLAKDDPALSLISPWFATFDGPKAAISSEDSALVARLVANPAITAYPNLYAPAQAMGADVVRLRPLIDARLLAADPPDKWLKSLAHIYRLMPPGTFAANTPAEAAILADPVRRKFAQPLIRRQADRGAAAVPQLLDILRYHALLARGPHGTDDSHMAAIDGVRQALCLMGGAGASALPELERMLNSGAIFAPLNNASDWKFVLARLGKPVAEIPKPQDTGNSDEAFRRNLQEKLNHFDPEQSCRSNWG